MDCTRDGLFPLVDCRFYVQCAGGMAFEKPCPPGTYFSPLDRYCGFDDSSCHETDQAPVSVEKTDDVPERLINKNRG